MQYVDTSVLVSLFVPEPDSATVRAWFDARPTASFIISDWTLVEFASAMGLKVRRGALRRAQASTACSLMNRLAEDSFRIVTPTRDDYRRAAGYLARHELGLRAGDALHAAIAQGEGALELITLDRRLVAAGRRLKLRVTSPV